MNASRAAFVLAALAVALSCAHAQEHEAEEPGTPAAEVSEMQVQLQVDAHAAENAPELERGMASWYGPRFHGRRTASGEVYNMHELTAAHPKLPFGSVVRVQSRESGRSVEVRINDRGPHVRKRIIDLSRAAAQALGLLESGAGLKEVTLTVLNSSARLRENLTSGIPARTRRHRR